jgi:SMC interacting uncharacterized protein involved in chromosome segregation
VFYLLQIILWLKSNVTNNYKYKIKRCIIIVKSDMIKIEYNIQNNQGDYKHKLITRY